MSTVSNTMAQPFTPCQEGKSIYEMVTQQMGPSYLDLFSRNVDLEAIRVICQLG